MKKMPKLRFKEFKEVYKSNQLNKLSNFDISYPFSRANEGKGEIHHIHYGDIHTKLPTIIKDVTVLPSIKVKKDFSFLKKGDIIIADASEDYKDLGKAVCFSGENKFIIAGLHTHRVTPNYNNIVSEYLVRYLQTENYRKFIYRKGTGVSVLGLSKTNLAKLIVNYPNLEEQKKVAELFKKIDMKIEKQNKKIKLLKKEKNGLMKKVFNLEYRFKDDSGNFFSKWKIVSLNAVTDINPKTESLEEKFLYIDLESVENGMLKKLTLLNKDDAPSRAKRVVKKGDILYQTVRPYQKNNLYYDDNIKFQVVASTGYAQIRVKESIQSSYLYHYLSTEVFTRNVLSRCTGTSYPAINSSELSLLKIYLPQIEEQKKIAMLFNKLDLKIIKEFNKHQLLEQQKHGFMQQMFI